VLLEQTTVFLLMDNVSFNLFLHFTLQMRTKKSSRCRQHVYQRSSMFFFLYLRFLSLAKRATTPPKTFKKSLKVFSSKDGLRQMEAWYFLGEPYLQRWNVSTFAWELQSVVLLTWDKRSQRTEQGGLGFVSLTDELTLMARCLIKLDGFTFQWHLKNFKRYVEMLTKVEGKTTAVCCLEWQFQSRSIARLHFMPYMQIMRETSTKNYHICTLKDPFLFFLTALGPPKWPKVKISRNRNLL